MKLSEDTLILNGLTPDITRMEEVYETIEDFLTRKKKEDPTDRFNIILFQNSGPNYLNDFTLNPENIILALKSLEPMLIDANVAYGIFIAATFIIDVFKRITHKAFRLIILKDSGTAKVPPHYVPVLENLLEKVKGMPFYIDIVQIALKSPDKDENLVKLAKFTGGDIYSIKKIKDLRKSISIKHDISQERYDELKLIPEGNRLFFINLAEYPINFKRVEKCSICFQRDDEGLVKCPNCEVVSHKSCLAQWSESSNIGIKNVFRCHNCYNLLKLDEEYINLVKYGKVKLGGDIQITEINLKDFQESLEQKKKPEIIKANDSLIPPTEQKQVAEKESVRFILCPHCHKMITNKYEICPNCNKKL